MKNRVVEIFAGYFKEGDDLSYHLEQCKGNSIHALASWAMMLEHAAGEIKRIAEILSDEEESPEIQADTHYIGLSGLEDSTIDRLIEETSIASESDWDEEDEEDLEDEDDSDPDETDDM